MQGANSKLDDERTPSADAARFSLSKWQTRLAERCAQHRLPGKAPPRGTGRLGSMSCGSNGGPTAVPNGTSTASSIDDVQHLSEHFRSRDSSRTRRSVLPLASALQTSDADKVQDQIAGARDDLLALAHESWLLLQERYPYAAPHRSMPYPESAPNELELLGRKSRCPAHLLPHRPSSCSTATGTTGLEQSDRHSEHVCLQGSATSLCGRTLQDCLVKVIDIDEDESSIGKDGEDRLVKVVDIDEDETWLGPLVCRSMCRSVCDCGCGGRDHGKGNSNGSTPGRMSHEPFRRAASDVLRLSPCSHEHDDWELQYMVTGIIEDVVNRLQRDGSDAGVGEATLHLDHARERMLEWIVKRWYDCIH